MKRIAIQGELGSFHDIAAHQYFGDEQVELICCATFEEVFENIKRDPTVIGIVAIENTIAGSLLHNYELLRQSGTTVVGEHRLHIEHSICCLPDDDWSTLQEVHSHPVALMQCGRFLANHPDLKAVEAEDTAGSAAFIAKHQVRGWAAICSTYAAEMYGMKVLQEGIHDNPHNYTRFLVVSNPQKAALLRPIEKEQVYSVFKDNRNVKYMGSVPYTQVQKRMAESDITVIVEGFEEKDINLSRYSLSTKAADALASGASILTYGSLESGIIEYMLSTDAAMVCTDKTKLADSIAHLISDQELQRKYYEQAIVMTREHHNLQASCKTSEDVVAKAIRHMK